MALSDEVYMKYHISELVDLDVAEAKLWKEGQNRWCVRHHGMTSEKWYSIDRREPK